MSNTAPAAMSHKETTSHLRARLKHHGIKCCVRMTTACGIAYILVDVPSYDSEFNDDAQRQIRLTAKNIGLTFARGAEIDIERMTNPKAFAFEFKAN
jgi:hypothetical protein